MEMRLTVLEQSEDLLPIGIRYLVFTFSFSPFLSTRQVFQRQHCDNYNYEEINLELQNLEA